MRDRRTGDRSRNLRRALRIRRAGVCGALACAAAVLPQLRAHPPGDRVGRSPRLPCHRRAGARRQRHRQRHPGAGTRHRWRGDRNRPHRNHRDHRLPVRASTRRFGATVRHDGSARGFADMTPSRTQELAVLRSVTYAAMFEYPLSLEQLHASLIGVRADAATVAAWWRNSELLQATIDHQEGLYFPAGRADLLHTRARREALSCDLLARDRRILSVVAAMPFVRMVALSGSLAHLNAERSADLDRKSTRLNSSHSQISYAVFCLKKKNKLHIQQQASFNTLR